MPLLANPNINIRGVVSFSPFFKMKCNKCRNHFPDLQVFRFDSNLLNNLSKFDKKFLCYSCYKEEESKKYYAR
jgi:hypothetical protein